MGEDTSGFLSCATRSTTNISQDVSNARIYSKIAAQDHKKNAAGTGGGPVGRVSSKPNQNDASKGLEFKIKDNKKTVHRMGYSSVVEKGSALSNHFHPKQQAPLPRNNNPQPAYRVKRKGDIPHVRDAQKALTQLHAIDFQKQKKVVIYTKEVKKEYSVQPLQEPPAENRKINEFLKIRRDFVPKQKAGKVGINVKFGAMENAPDDLSPLIPAVSPPNQDKGAGKLPQNKETADAGKNEKFSEIYIGTNVINMPKSNLKDLNEPDVLELPKPPVFGFTGLGNWSKFSRKSNVHEKESLTSGAADSSSFLKPASNNKSSDGIQSTLKPQVAAGQCMAVSGSVPAGVGKDDLDAGRNLGRSQNLQDARDSPEGTTQHTLPGGMDYPQQNYQPSHNENRHNQDEHYAAQHSQMQQQQLAYGQNSQRVHPQNSPGPYLRDQPQQMPYMNHAYYHGPLYPPGSFSAVQNISADSVQPPIPQSQHPFPPQFGMPQANSYVHGTPSGTRKPQAQSQVPPAYIPSGDHTQPMANVRYANQGRHPTYPSGEVHGGFMPLPYPQEFTRAHNILIHKGHMSASIARNDNGYYDGMPQPRDALQHPGVSAVSDIHEQQLAIIDPHTKEKVSGMRNLIPEPHHPTAKSLFVQTAPQAIIVKDPGTGKPIDIHVLAQRSSGDRTSKSKDGETLDVISEENAAAAESGMGKPTAVVDGKDDEASAVTHPKLTDGVEEKDAGPRQKPAQSGGEIIDQKSAPTKDSKSHDNGAEVVQIPKPTGKDLEVDQKLELKVEQYPQPETDQEPTETAGEESKEVKVDQDVHKELSAKSDVKGVSKRDASDATKISKFGSNVTSGAPDAAPPSEEVVFTVESVHGSDGIREHAASEDLPLKKTMSQEGAIIEEISEKGSVAALRDGAIAPRYAAPAAESVASSLKGGLVQSGTLPSRSDVVTVPGSSELGPEATAQVISSAGSNIVGSGEIYEDKVGERKDGISQPDINEVSAVAEGLTLDKDTAAGEGSLPSDKYPSAENGRDTGDTAEKLLDIRDKGSSSTATSTATGKFNHVMIGQQSFPSPLPLISRRSAKPPVRQKDDKITAVGADGRTFYGRGLSQLSNAPNPSLGLRHIEKSPTLPHVSASVPKPPECPVDSFPSVEMISDFKSIKYPQGVEAPSVSADGKYRYSKAFLSRFRDIHYSWPCPGFPLSSQRDYSNAYRHDSKFGDRAPTSRDLSHHGIYRPEWGGDTGGWHHVKSREGGDQRMDIYQNNNMGHRTVNAMNFSRSPMPYGAQYQHFYDSSSSSMSRHDNRGMRGSGYGSQASYTGHASGLIHEITLTHSENAWKPHSNLSKFRDSNLSKLSLSDQLEVLGNRFRGLLNKVTISNFQFILDSLFGYDLLNREYLNLLVDMIFEKTLSESGFCKIYAKLCGAISTRLFDLVAAEAAKREDADFDPKEYSFRTVIVLKCQNEFEKQSKWAEESRKVAEEIKEARKNASSLTFDEKQKLAEREYEQNLIKRRALGNMNFIGDLYLESLISEKVINSCIEFLLGESPDGPEEEKVESLCKILSNIGPTLDKKNKESSSDFLDVHLQTLSNFIKSSTLSVRIKFMIQDLIELRENQWQQKKRVQHISVKSQDAKSRDGQGLGNEGFNRMHYGRGNMGSYSRDSRTGMMSSKMSMSTQGSQYPSSFSDSKSGNWASKGKDHVQTQSSDHKDGKFLTNIERLNITGVEGNRETISGLFLGPRHAVMRKNQTGSDLGPPGGQSATARKQKIIGAAHDALALPTRPTHGAGSALSMPIAYGSDVSHIGSTRPPTPPPPAEDTDKPQISDETVDAIIKEWSINLNRDDVIAELATYGLKKSVGRFMSRLMIPLIDSSRTIIYKTIKLASDLYDLKYIEDKSACIECITNAVHYAFEYGYDVPNLPSVAGTFVGVMIKAGIVDSEMAINTFKNNCPTFLSSAASENMFNKALEDPEAFDRR